MAFTYARPTNDASSPSPAGFGFSEVAFDIVNTGGSTGGVMVVPFTTIEDIEIVGWTPTATGAYPYISATGYQAAEPKLPTITIVFPADVDGRLRLRGRGM